MQKYLRLLTYDNACKVIAFINDNDKKDYAHITPGGVSMSVSEQNWDKVETFIKSLDVRYEIGDEPPHKVNEQIVANLKKAGVIKSPTKTFTLLQLFNIIDGRLVTSMDDVYDILGHIVGGDLMTHQLPVAMDFLREKNPLWFKDLTKKLADIKNIHRAATSLESLVFVIKEQYHIEYGIPQFSQEEQSEFSAYLVKNSPLAKFSQK